MHHLLRVLGSFSWRGFLLISGFLVVVGSVYYTLELSSTLKEEERKRIELWAEAQERMLGATEEQFAVCDFTLHSLVQSQNTNIPVILVDEALQIIDALNYPGYEYPKDKSFFEAELQALRQEAAVPIAIENPLYKNYIYYRPSSLIEQLEWFPYIQYSLLAVFLFFGYLSFSLALQAQKERIWVGMAKETAHQLGTPISSLNGWIDYIEQIDPENEELEMVCEELGKDVQLLEIVAERFSKIGAKAELQEVNIYKQLDKHLQYVKQRASRKIVFDFPNAEILSPLHVKLNPLLFDWVIENLLKNALDAMETGEGEISVDISEDERHVFIDLSDTGKGMPKNLFKKIFKPGFSTKKRGWGLGLSLCKRIIEQYHKGSIYVKNSRPQLGTTFRIQLKK